VPQRTIERPATLAGIGIHTNRPSTVACRPAPVDAGIVFARLDLPGAPAVRASALEVVDTHRGVTLGRSGGVRTVEHLLAAAAGLGVTNLRVEVRGEELPILDGSAAPYVEALRSAGVVDQGARLRVAAPSQPQWLARDSAWILAVPADRLRVTYIVPLLQTRLGTQVADFDAARDRFAEQIAPARTWGFADELEALRRAGLALGASAGNALGIARDGYLSPPRFPNEPARHKVLDLIGDLALIGAPLQAHVIACGAGHALHLELARRIAASAMR